MNANRFANGSGCFKCKACGKMTRSVGAGDNAGCEMCELCYEKSSCENSLSDNGWGNHGDLEHCTSVAEVEREYTRIKDAAEAALSPATTTTLDITPTWSSILPVLLRVHEDATTPEERTTAFRELQRMAQLADAYVDEHK